jgi:MSHA biogenesis protein MshJ
MKMKERFVKVREVIDRLSLRERLFLVAAGLVIVGGVWEAALAGPLDARKQQAAAKVESLKHRLEVLDTALNSAATGMSAGVPAELDQLTALRAHVAAGDEEVRVFTSDLVDPQEMRLVLEELLRRQNGLKLVSATNLPARPLIEGDVEPAGANDGVARPKSAEPQLYRHALVLTLEGNYLDCLAYLQAVERLPWHLYWSRLEFTSDDYPRNAIVIELRTLSLDKEWIGV